MEFPLLFTENPNFDVTRFMEKDKGGALYKLGTNKRIEDTAEARISQEILYYIQTSTKIKDPL